MKRRLACMALLLVMAGCATATFEDNREVSRSMVRLAENELRQGELNKALVELTKAVEINPKDSEVHYFLAETYRQLNKLEDALKHIELSIRNAKHIGLEHPGMASEAFNLKGLILYQQGEIDQAIKAFEDSLNDDLYATPEYSLFNMGNIYYSQKRVAEARNVYEQALQRNPHYAPAWHAMGVIQHDEGNYDAARYAFQKAILEHPNYAEAHWSLAMLSIKVGDNKTSVQHFQEVIRLDPDNLRGLKGMAEDQLTRLRNESRGW